MLHGGPTYPVRKASVIPPDRVYDPVDMAKRGRPPYADILTPREWEVLATLCEGLSNEEIAERLDITVRTARYHVSEILGKLGVSSREEAARWQPEKAPGWALLGAPFVFMWKKATFAGIAAAGAGATFVGVASVAALVAWGSLPTTDGVDTDMANVASPSVFETATPPSESPKSNSEIELVGVDIPLLARKGTILSEVPPGRSATITKEQAVALATTLPGVTAIDAVLVHVRNTVHDRDAWVVSLEGIMPGDPFEGIGEVILFVGFVDAATGENFITWRIRQPPPGGFPEPKGRPLFSPRQLSPPNSIGLDVD